jgi:hypothetical protein
MRQRVSSALTNRKAALERYREALEKIPPSGGGGCHSALLGIANRGRMAGVSPDRIAEDLEAHVHGTRKIPRPEIDAAVDKAFDASPNVPFRSATPRPRVDGVKLLNAIVNRGAGFEKADLRKASPIRIDWEPESDAIELLRRLFDPNDCIFIGVRHDASAGQVQPVSHWIRRFERGLVIPEHIIPNPLTGKQGETKTGKLSYRADSCVEQFRFAVVEFDGMPLEQQIRFWAGVPLPIVALVSSGGKSIHGWIRIDAANADEWTLRVESKLFAILTAMGADPTCKNEARLSRMPGHFRADTNKWQRVLYLDPIGGPITR